MRYTIPQFIEHEPKIVGPFTFKQFIYIGVAGALAFILYTYTPFYIFLVGSMALGGGAMVFAFMKVGGRSFPEMIKNFLIFSVATKIYLWKKGPPPKMIKKEIPKKKVGLEPEEETPKLTATGDSQLSKLSTKIETKIK